MKLTPNQIDVLESLEWANIRSSYPLQWARPLDLGATNSSHHSATLAALAKKGLVQFKQRGEADPPPGENGRKRFRTRGSKCYRITPEGIAELDERRG
jgi:hypothetical protein